jgi:hypothetical protein
MQLDLTDEETFALLNLLVQTIEADRYAFSPRIRVLREIPREVWRTGSPRFANWRASAARLDAPKITSS